MHKYSLFKWRNIQRNGYGNMTNANRNVQEKTISSWKYREKIIPSWNFFLQFQFCYVKMVW